MNLYLLTLLLSVIAASFSQLLLKKSASRAHDSFIREYLNPYVICGYGIMFFSLFLTMIAYRGLDYTSIPVTESSGYVIVMFLSCLFLHEKITRRKVLGTVLILGGILVYYLV